MRFSVILVTPYQHGDSQKKGGKPQYPETPLQRLSPVTLHNLKETHDQGSCTPAQPGA
jgi:hypothetical protein